MQNKYEKLINNILSSNNKYNNNELEYVLSYLNSEDPNNDVNPWTSRLEDKFCEMFNVKYAIAHNSGTSTLHSCLHAAGVCAGDEIIGSVQTGIWFPFVCLHQNAIPVYVDSDESTFNMNTDLIEEKITENTKVIIATHMHGTPSGLEKIMKIADKYKLTVIEDCAQSFLATVNNNITGSIGHMGSFSFETKKHMATGQGGMVITNDKNLAIQIRKHAGLGYVTLTEKQGMTTLMPHEFQNPNFKRHDTLAYNYRMPEICAAIGLAQLEDLENKVRRRINIANMYNEVLKDVDWIIPQKIEDQSTSTFWSYAVKYEGENKYGVKWENFYELFKLNGGDGFYGGYVLLPDEIIINQKSFYGTYIPSDYKKYENKFHVSSDDYPVAKKLQKKIMQFKTGFRDLAKAKKSINALRKTINDILK